MFSEFINNAFNIESKLFRTLRAMFVPGKLTEEYFKGRHIRYYHPLRLFLFTGIALFAVLTLKLSCVASLQKRNVLLIFRDLENNNPD